MTEFTMPLGSGQITIGWGDLDAFTQGYLEAMFFTETGTGDDEEEGLQDAEFDELSIETLGRIIEDCRVFQINNGPQLEHAYEASGVNYLAEQAGRDYWYSRNGHGVGFWDRDLGLIGDDLHKACQHTEVSLYRGDDGRLYLS